MNETKDPLSDETTIPYEGEGSEQEAQKPSWDDLEPTHPIFSPAEDETPASPAEPPREEEAPQTFEERHKDPAPSPMAPWETARRPALIRVWDSIKKFFRRLWQQINRSPVDGVPPTWVILLVLVLFIIVAAIGIGGILANMRHTPESSAEGQTPIGKLSTFLSPPTVPADQPVLQENGSVLSLSMPGSLTIADQTFPIIPVQTEEGRWPIPAEDKNVAVWIYGTVINYVVGLPFTATNQALLSTLTDTSRLTLTLTNGGTLVFGSPKSQLFQAEDTSPMTQTQPGLTVVLVGETGLQAQRQVVQARYLPEESQLNTSSQRIGDLQINVLKSGVVGEDAGGSRYFIVEYQITNQGTAPANPAMFDISLEDGQGQRYLANPDASSRGERGQLIAPVAPGASAEASVGYLIPRNTQAPLTWVFRPDPTTANSGNFVLPYQPPVPRPAQPNVTLTGAFIDNAREVIVINGVIRNLGENPLTINPTDVALTSGTGSSELRTSSPTLPWTINGGAEQSFELQFARPQGVTSVLVNVAGFTFELQGLQ